MLNAQTEKTASLILSYAALAALGYALLMLLTRFFSKTPFSGGKFKGNRIRQILFALGLFALSRAAVYLAGLLSFAVSGNLSQYLADPVSPWVRWDARHYLALAQNGYTTAGDARFLLVFFPLYPLLVRGLSLVSGLNPVLSGTILSNVCFLVSLYLMLRLTEAQQDAPAGRRAAAFLAFCPMSFVFSGVFSESLFLMLCLISVYCARNRHTGWAAVFGAMASAARLLGLAVAVPLFYEHIHGKNRNVSLAVLKTLPVSLGFLAYLGLNRYVSGSAFTFLRYQSEHWSQRMGDVGNTLRYTLDNALHYEDQALRWGTWTPQLLFILLAILLIALTARKIHPGDGAFCLIYLWFAVSPTWLLSGCRYLSAMYGLYPMLAMTAKNRIPRIVAFVFSVAGSVFLIYMYLIPSGVM